MLTLKRIEKNSPEFDEVYNIRSEVFAVEQNVPINLLVDEADAAAIQIAAYENDTMIGCGRIVIEGKTGKIGRVAVLANKRKLGVGRLICEELINAAVAEYNVRDIILAAQCTARKFYENLGFKAFGSVYVRAGIEHIDMIKKLSK